MVFRGESLDYCYKEAIQCLRELCDYVVVVDCGSDDNTVENLRQFEDNKCLVMYRNKEEWDLIKGREKLSYFTNIAIDKTRELGYEWQFNLQADEIIHERSFPYIWGAIGENNKAYFCTRINLWGNSKYQLNVPQERKPVSTEIIRLAHTNFYSYDDAESLCVPLASTEYLNDIRVYHMGFIRDKRKHIEKIKHIQDEVFLIDHDKRVDNMTNGFDPMAMGFTKDDLIPVSEPLPKFIKSWAEARDEINKNKPI